MRALLLVPILLIAACSDSGYPYPEYNDDSWDEFDEDRYYSTQENMAATSSFDDRHQVYFRTATQVQVAPETSQMLGLMMADPLTPGGEEINYHSGHVLIEYNSDLSYRAFNSQREPISLDLVSIDGVEYLVAHTTVNGTAEVDGRFIVDISTSFYEVILDIYNPSDLDVSTSVRGYSLNEI